MFIVLELYDTLLKELHGKELKINKKTFIRNTGQYKTIICNV